MKQKSSVNFLIACCLLLGAAFSVNPSPQCRECVTLDQTDRPERSEQTDRFFSAASSPRLNLILPRGVQRGQTHTLEFYGERLGDAQEIFF